MTHLELTAEREREREREREALLAIGVFLFPSATIKSNHWRMWSGLSGSLGPCRVIN